MVGQLVGGLLVTADVAGTGWRPIFLVNVPIGVVALIAAGRFVPASRSPHPLGLDLVGTLLFAGTLVALLVPLAEGPTIGWPPWSWGALALVPVLAAATVVIERRAEVAGRVPLLPPSLLRLRSMRRGFAMHLPFMLTYGAFMFVFALTVQTGLHSGVLGGGLAVLPLAVAYFAGSLAAPRAIARFDTRRVVAVAAVAVALGLLVLVLVTVTTWPNTDYWAFAPGLVLAGAGQALVFACLFRLILLDVPEHLVGVGGGGVTTVQQSGLALGVATLGTLFVGLEKTGVGTAFVVSLAVQAAIMLAIAAGSLTLPHLQARPGETGVSVDV
ncbi:MFS transporter [Streptomyces mirabilis]|uniref:MFS transporter n=1 Tax=Streptomyces mirabilis TaxID=68239 RepID=UPI00225B7A32|nr:MFS transporter [Streptomyces mirabilis]MCX4427577.1 MFS transporter [Streptomyces mirabilis]